MLSEVTAWQSRPLETMYPVVFFDALRVKIREDAVVRSKAVYRAPPAAWQGPEDNRNSLNSQFAKPPHTQNF